MERKGPDDTLRMRRMIWIRAFYACLKALFSLDDAQIVIQK